MRRDIGSHANGDTHLAIEKDIRNGGREHGRLFLWTIEIITKVYGFFLYVG